MHHILSAIILTLLALGICRGEELGTNLVPRVIIFVPVGTENEEPVVVFSVKNTGKTELSVKPFLSPGSELEWSGPRGITWRAGIGTSTPTTVLIPVPPGTDVEVSRMPLHDLYLEMGMGAKVHDQKLIDGDDFRVSWKVDGASSNPLFFRFSRAK